MMAVVSISITLQLIISMSVLVEATRALERAVISACRACEVMMAGTELLSKARALVSVEVQANVQVSLGILFASSELSSVERVSKMASERSLPVRVSTVVIPVPEGLSLVADISLGVVITAINLEGVIFVRALVSVTGILVSLVSASGMVPTGIEVLSEVWVPRVSVSKGMWLGTGVSMRSGAWAFPSELVLIARVTAVTSVWFIVPKEPGLRV